MHRHGKISLAPLVFDTPFFGTGLLVLARVDLVADALGQVEAVVNFLRLGGLEILHPLHPAHVVPAYNTVKVQNMSPEPCEKRPCKTATRHEMESQNAYRFAP